MMSTLFPVKIEYFSSMRIGLGPSNNFSIEIPHRSAGVTAFSHAVLLVSGHARPDNFNSATQVTHAQLITAHNRLTLNYLAASMAYIEEYIFKYLIKNFKTLITIFTILQLTA